MVVVVLKDVVVEDAFLSVTSVSSTTTPFFREVVVVASAVVLPNVEAIRFTVELRDGETSTSIPLPLMPTPELEVRDARLVVALKFGAPLIVWLALVLIVELKGLKLVLVALVIPATLWLCMWALLLLLWKLLARF